MQALQWRLQLGVQALDQGPLRAVWRLPAGGSCSTSRAARVVLPVPFRSYKAERVDGLLPLQQAAVTAGRTQWTPEPGGTWWTPEPGGPPNLPPEQWFTVPEQWFTAPEQHCSRTVKQLFRGIRTVLFRNSDLPRDSLRSALFRKSWPRNCDVAEPGAPPRDTVYLTTTVQA